MIGRAVLTCSGAVVEATFGGEASVAVPHGSSRWTDSIALPVQTGDEIVVDLYVPTPLALGTGNFARTPVEISVEGDHAGAAPFPAVTTPTIPAPDGSEISIPVPFLRAVEIDGDADAVVACLGDSITAGGWPELAAALLAPHTGTVMLNLGIAGNRLRIDPAPETASYGRSGLSRFAEDVLASAGVTDVVIALGGNDLGLPGATAPLEELPTVDELLDAYTKLIGQAEEAGIRVVVATITPFMGAEGFDLGREGLREAVNNLSGDSVPMRGNPSDPHDVGRVRSCRRASRRCAPPQGEARPGGSGRRLLPLQ